ncbi:GNAT family N-acetyltransferase [Cryobacterium sp. Sr8]|uniref:bifunctional UDP-2,4-diacetamido-2,4,6-trideoxy-beta-L-altropyranose hydrolase/GNAT family N-acetyltransferase n=1 Tax=Cryobacterium sp. Sr8 TaxID=1259203 RepID=UPI00106CF430|nr:bifunctional UDP-2,4-diacetamido-2,4,6-trideoxy-beta-L-altropyranose hydrolase/GNAT family N-acetyltransferase [Cryobacterium sp. Sr8]TFD81601.1 GNAT family N-acetyltransferase [Cryobacterium sp. Sr8]
MHLLIRCDASKGEGVGHLVRSMALVEEAASRGWQVTLSGDIDVPFGREFLERLGVRQVPAVWTAEGLTSMAQDLGVDLIHIDHYDLVGDFRIVINKAGVLLSSLEDGGYGRRAADLVIDPSPVAAERYRPSDGSGRLMLGAAAVPLRPLVRQLAAERDARFGQTPGSAPGLIRMVVMLGGTDALNATAQVLGMIRDSGVSADCAVIVDRGSWPDLPSSTPAFTISAHEPSVSAVELFRDADVAVTAAGGTLWEMLCMGVPTAVIQVIDNQSPNYDFATSHGLVQGLGAWSGPPAARAARLEQLRVLTTDGSMRAELARRGRQLIDGQGAARIVSHWEDMLADAPSHTVRSVSAGDASLLFDWRNDAIVRAASRETDELDWSAHLAWVKQAIADPDRYLLLVSQAGRPVATVRFDLTGATLHAWEVSITVAPESRGLGIGSAVLAAAEEHLGRLPYRADALVAAMRTENIASARLFASAGYQEQRVNGEPGMLLMRKDLA